MKKRKKIVLLLGAGFPVAWGAPFSKDILDRIIEDKEYMYDSNTTWGKFIFDTLKSFYEEEDGVTVNFETVIAASELPPSAFAPLFPQPTRVVTAIAAINAKLINFFMIVILLSYFLLLFFFSFLSLLSSSFL